MKNIDWVSFWGGSAAAAEIEECGDALNLSVGGKIDPVTPLKADVRRPQECGLVVTGSRQQMRGEGDFISPSVNNSAPTSWLSHHSCRFLLDNKTL